MQPETRFKMKVQKELDKLKPLVWYTKVQQVVKRGDPDLIICAAGKFAAWELKVGTNKATPLQAHTLSSISKALGWATVVTPENLQDSLWILKNQLKGFEDEPTRRLPGVPDGLPPSVV